MLVVIYIYTEYCQIQKLCSMYITEEAQVNNCTYIHMYSTTRGWAVSSPIIFMGSDTIYNFYNDGTVGQSVPLDFFSPGPSRTSSPPGAHNRGELSQLSLAYRYLSPKSKRIKTVTNYLPHSGIYLTPSSQYYITVQ